MSTQSFDRHMMDPKGVWPICPCVTALNRRGALSSWYCFLGMTSDSDSNGIESLDDALEFFVT